MAYPTLQFGRLTYGSADFFSDENNQNGFIRINADTTSGSPIITNVGEQAGGAFTTSELMVGMTLVSSGEFASEVTITNLDLGNNQLTVSANATATAQNQVMRIRPAKGMYFFESASFAKVGTGEPSDLRDITGSEDAEYDTNELKWGVVAALAETGSVTTTVVGLYGQYEITEIQSRISNTQMNFFATASDSLPSFIEESGSQISAGSSTLMVSQISNNLMTIAGASDVGGGGQGLALGAYQTAVSSIFATLTSGSGGGDAFPYTGSAQITGSLGVTGSVEALLASNENFLIKNATAPTQSLFKVDDEGVAVFRAREGADGVPSAVVGGLYFTTSSAFLGVD
jgi:hypothetical protein